MVVGTLQCADKQGNLVLHESVEFLPGRCESSGCSTVLAPDYASLRSGSTRKLGLVLVPRSHRAAVHAVRTNDSHTM